MATRTSGPAGLAGLAGLAEPTRRALYLYVQAQDGPVSRDEAAAGVGVPRHKAKFHLDKLVDDGLLETEFARRTGRQGPGAGRPAKLYRRAAQDLAVTVPERRYELAGQLMARAISDALTEDQPVAGTLRRAARDRGRWLADIALRKAGDGPSGTALLAAARGVLDDEGYETRDDPAGLTLANCPFRALAAEHTDLVCGMNLAIMEGMLERLGRRGWAAVLDPAEGRCCVRLVAEGRSRGAGGMRRNAAG
jgi:predicted ArsR family transcriptional regulator